jgi:uncharacterized membrane protein
MGPVAILFGVLLMLLGIGFYFGTDRVSLTALIPGAFGIVLIVLGVLAGQQKLRKHVMHAAAALALLGVVMALIRLWPVIRTGEAAKPAAAVELALMAVLCAAFVGLCVRSFIAARRGRDQSPSP